MTRLPRPYVDPFLRVGEGPFAGTAVPSSAEHSSTFPIRQDRRRVGPVSYAGRRAPPACFSVPSTRSTLGTTALHALAHSLPLCRGWESGPDSCGIALETDRLRRAASPPHSTLGPTAARAAPTPGSPSPGMRIPVDARVDRTEGKEHLRNGEGGPGEAVRRQWCGTAAVGHCLHEYAGNHERRRLPTEGAACRSLRPYRSPAQCSCQRHRSSMSLHGCVLDEVLVISRVGTIGGATVPMVAGFRCRGIGQPTYRFSCLRLTPAGELAGQRAWASSGAFSRVPRAIPESAERRSP